MTQVLDQTGTHVHLELVESYLASLLTLAILQLYGRAGEHFNATRGQLNRAILFVGAIIAVVVDGDADGQLLVVVAEFRHEERVRLPPRVQIVIRRLGLKHLHHVLGLILACSLDHQVGRVVAEAQQSLCLESRGNLEFDDVFRLFYFVRTHSQSATIVSISDLFAFGRRKSQVKDHLLVLGEHELTQIHLTLSN